MSLKDVKLCISTPCYGDQCYVEYMSSLLNTAQVLRNLGVNVVIEFLVHESLITRARNTLVAKFLSDPTNTHLLFIDADIGWRPEEIVDMLNSNLDLVGGIYPKKHLRFDRLKSPEVADYINQIDIPTLNRNLNTHLLDYVLDGHSHNQYITNSQFQSVKYVGTGFMLIKRNVVEKLIAAYPNTKYINPQLNEIENNYNYALFDCAVVNDNGNDVYLSEDFLFCKRWLDIGGTIWANFHSKLTHVGLYRYNGDVAGRFELYK